MNREIERLLKLSRIPGFKLLEKEQGLLDEWKRQQVEVKPIAPKRKYTRRKKTTNNVKAEEKEIGTVEPEEIFISHFTES